MARQSRPRERGGRDERRRAEEPLSPVSSNFAAYASVQKDTTILAVLEFERAHTRDQLELLVGRLLGMWPVLAAEIVRARGRWVYKLAGDVAPASFLDVRQSEESLGDLIKRAMGELACLGQQKAPHFGMTQLTSTREEGSALILRVSHAVSDGEGLLGLLRDLATECVDGDGAPEDSGAKNGNAAPLAGTSTAAALRPRKTNLSFFSRYVTAPLWSVLGPMLVPVLPGDQRNPLHTPTKQHGEPTCFVQCSLPLADVAAVGKALGSHTVTSVLLALLSGGVRRYLTELGHKPPSSIRVVVPVTLRSGSQPTANRLVSGPLCGLRRNATAPNLNSERAPLTAQDAVASEGASAPALTDAVRRARSSGSLRQAPSAAGGPENAHELDVSASEDRTEGESSDRDPTNRGHNRLGLVFLPIDLRPAPAETRLIRASDAIFKVTAYAQVPTATVMLGLLSATLPHKLFARVCHLFATKSSGSFSTLKGPSKRLALDGIPIKRLYNTVTPSINAWTISALSYGGEMTVCVLANEGALVEPERLLRCIQDELAAMMQEALSHTP